jgi:hypothetical protein
MLLARLATKRAKPDGQAVVGAGPEARALLGDLGVDELPGVGWSLSKRLAELGISRVRQARACRAWLCVCGCVCVWLCVVRDCVCFSECVRFVCGWRVDELQGGLW